MAYQLQEINRRVRSGAAEFLAECDENYAQRVSLAADRILSNLEHSPIVLLSGPSGSGKTTTAMKIAEELLRRGVNSRAVAMDNYFLTQDPATVPRTPDGSIDYESPLCLDMDLLSQHFAALSRGEEILIPKFEFARQMRNDSLGTPLKLEKNEIAIFAGIHALNDIIVGKNPRAFKLYIAARSDILDEDGSLVFDKSWIRLCRRIVRDFKFRGSDAAFTLKLWENVRRGERLYISPYKENADLMFDSSLALSASALKPFVVPLLEELPKGKYQVVEDILRGLDKIEALDEKHIPAKSLSREFIGGSPYDNH